ncbi:uncharacterized protein pks1 [Myripristis murdjan]|uniref:Mycolipanoate synthase-like n=1 Tax=Myripristis murdjan TaxID=586833 RepID=A0A667ZBW2_9TELE|nr:uncharacterized protein LOC115379029 [Myripristis murdjan]
MEDTEDDIAVVGIGCNFPGGEGLGNFWRVLLEGKNCVVDIPEERFDSACWFDPDDSKPGKTQTTRAALINGFNEFDHKFFGITEAEADFMDPQQKLLLQCTHRALEDAGVAMETISGSRTGVYIGLMNRDYENLLSNSASTITHYNGTGTAMSVAANRISFTFNLTGPSFAIDSACSSSLVALHTACQAIKLGDCEMALCGGVSCIIEPRVFVALSKAKMISPEGTSKPFSSRADGYGRGEGCGVVLLKPLKNAVRDFNKIWGIISKTAVNQDGHTVSPITKPSVVQQEELLRSIYLESDLANVQYIEAHGTGTPVGDPTEATSISNVIAKARPPGSETLRIGSVKSNIGHTESAAGVAGLIKVLLMMKHETIVPTVFYSEHSASIDVQALSIKIPTKAEKWEINGSLVRVAGINSFGFGGTNAHAIVKQHRQDTIPKLIPHACRMLFAISAATEKSLISSLTDTHQRLCRGETVDIQALSYTSACRRSHYKHKYRRAFLTSSLSDLDHQLTSALTKKVEPTKSDIRLVFVFCGNGVTYKGMCKQLLREVPIFREKIREVDNLFQKYKATSIRQKIDDDYDNDDYTKPDVVQPLLFAIQVGIASLLQHWGIKPDAVLGHSVGEVAAAHCSGLLSLEDAVKVVHHRSTLQSKVTGGKMLVVSNVAVEKVLKVLPTFSGKICAAAFNSPQSCTLSGDADAIDTLHQEMKTTFTDKNLLLHVLDVPAAYHSHMMDPIVDDIEKSIDSLAVNNMECELFSTVTGEKCSDGNFVTGRYWAKNIREPVLFKQTLQAATKDGHSKRNVIFVEISPRRALQRNIHETLGGDHIVLPSVQPEKDYKTILCTVAKLFELGIHVDWHKLYSGSETLPTAFPVYQFDNLRKEVCFEAVRKGNETTVYSHHPLISQVKQDKKEYKCDLSLETASYLWEHKNNGVTVVPGALYVELAYASVMASLRPKKPTSLLQLCVHFSSLLTLSSNSYELKVTLNHRENETTFKIQSPSSTHAFGTYWCAKSQPLIEQQSICLDMISQRCKLVMTRKEIYSILCRAGFEYGSVFKQLDDVHFGDEFKEAVTTFQVPGEILTHLHDYFIHPVLLDYFLQLTAVVAMGKLTTKQGFPSGIGSVVMSGPLQEEMVMYLRATHETPDFLEVCGCFSTKEGHVLVELKQARISFLGHPSNVAKSLFFHNEIISISNEIDFNCKIKAIVFEDKLGIAKALRPYLHPESTMVKTRDHWVSDQLQGVVFNSLHNGADLDEVLFIWGVQDLSHLSSEKTLECLVTCCELFRQIILILKASKRSYTVRVITYRSTERTVDHISPGFVLSGLTRACAAEIQGLSFQLIDLPSVTSEDIQALVHVINTCKQQEVMISQGQVSATKIVRTPITDMALCEGDLHSMHMGDFVLQTADPYKVAKLCAIPCDAPRNFVQENSVEIQLMNICVHSSDYFPVSTSHLNFSETMYWNKHTSQSHTLLALDFSGIVTAIGKNVHDLKIGDHVVSCYPVAATSKVVIPEAVCYNTSRLPFLRGTPCMSYFVLAWEILQRLLPEVKQNRKLAIISSTPASSLMKVLALTANRSGWNVTCQSCFQRELLNIDQCHAFIFLPPFDMSLQGINEGGSLERHIIFLCNNQMLSSPSAKKSAWESEHMHVHKLNVPYVFQRFNLKTQKRKILQWLMSLGFDTVPLPLKSGMFQFPGRREAQTSVDVESYFTAKIVQQVVLDHKGSNCPVSDIPLLTGSRQLFRQRFVYIVTGGLSGLGLETVKFIANKGGSCIATLSRRILSDETQFEMETLQKRCGVTIMNVPCDVSVSRQVEEAISKIRQRFPLCPIKGVFHSAAVLHDTLLETLDESLFQKVLKPKVNGALNLHYATLHDKLDFFVCYSSISSFIGNASQCNYAAANSFLDAFCNYRRNLGLAGQSINWGPLNLGLLLNKDHFQRFLEAKGMMIMDVCEVHEALEKCLLMNRPQQVICKFNFKNLNNHVLSQNASLKERLSPLVEMELKHNLTSEHRVQHLSSIHENVRTIVSEISDIGVDELDDDSSLCALGIDSMLAMTLQNKIFQETGVNVPLVRILDPSCTLNTLVTFVRGSG